MKFGGTSVGNGERICQVARIIKELVGESMRFVVVVSAMEGVTDSLIKAAQASAHDSSALRYTAAELGRRHREVAEAIALPQEKESLLGEIEALIEEFESLCRAIHVLGELTPRGLDAVASLGERLAVRLVAAAISAEGVSAKAVEATELVITDHNHGAASPLMEITRQKVQALLTLLKEGVIPVVTGFIGATPEGAITTLGRGGSDYSAAILGDCLEAEEIWIWTDVDGVMTADPRIVPDAKTLPEVSYAEAAELSYFGAKVIHPKTILPAVERGIPIRIKNTFNPQGPNTLIVAYPKQDKPTKIKAITSIKNLSLITVEGRGMLGVPGIAAKVFSSVAGEGISVLMISQSSSEQNICFVIRGEETDRALAALEEAFKPELISHNVDKIWAQKGAAIVAVVGAGMKGTPGIASKLFGALGRRNINIISIAQGSSEYNISLVVMGDDVEEAVRAIHKEFELGA